MRDLAKALSNIKIFEYDEDFVAVCDERNGMLSFPLGLVYEAIERAIKAESELERLKLMVKSITGGLDECMETVHFLEAENIKLRAVVEAAGKALKDVNCPTQDDLDNDAYEDYYHECFDRELCPSCGVFKLGQALAELDEEGEI
jgi:hypothetical protein